MNLWSFRFSFANLSDSLESKVIVEFPDERRLIILPSELTQNKIRVHQYDFFLFLRMRALSAIGLQNMLQIIDFV